MRFLERLRRVSVAGNRTLRVATDLRPTAVDPVMLLLLQAIVADIEPPDLVESDGQCRKI